ncbi:hypothetical protein BHE74_00044498 [Ensete ventricosum]|nr:hypothetical protein BHE74_00044498 [Ensete ventricosum]
MRCLCGCRHRWFGPGHLEGSPVAVLRFSRPVMLVENGSKESCLPADFGGLGGQGRREEVTALGTGGAHQPIHAHHLTEVHLLHHRPGPLYDR